MYLSQENSSMSLVLECETPPLREDETGAIRVGNSQLPNFD